MQKQMATFIASHGGAIVVTDESTMVQEVQIQMSSSSGLSEKSGSKKAKSKKPTGPVNKIHSVDRLGSGNQPNRVNGFE